MRYALFLSGWLAGQLLTFPLKAQSITMTQADSLRMLLRTNRADTNRVGALLGLSRHYQGRTLNYRHNLDTALVLVGQAEALSQQLGYDRGQQEALFQRGKIFIKHERLDKVKRMLVGVSTVTRIRLLLELGKNKLRPTYSQEAQLDSALLLFSQAEGLSKRLGSQPWQQESQMMTGVTYVFKGDCKAGKAWFRRVIQARQRAGDQAGELRAWLRWAVTQYSEWKFCENLDSLSRAFALTRQLGDWPREILLLSLVGYQYSFAGKQEQANPAVLKALVFQKAIGYPALNRTYHALLEENPYLSWTQLANLSNVNYSLADLNAQANNTNKDLLYNLEAIKDAERSGLWEELDWPYFYIGNIYFELEQYGKSLAYYKQSLAVSHRKGVAVVHVSLIRRMAQPLIKEGQARQALQLLTDFTNQHLPLSYENKVSITAGFGQCYAALGRNKLAEKYFLEAVAWGIKDSELSGPYTWRYISEFYVATAQYAKAAPYLRRMAALIAIGLMRPVEKLNLYLLQFKVDSAQANHPAALHHYQRYTALKDSLLNEKSSQQIAELDVRYQTRQKEQALQLRQKDIRLLTQQSHAQQTQRNAFIGGTLLLAALLGLGVNRYRLKQRSNQLLQTQQDQIHHKNEALQRLLEEKERLLKEIHHRVKNNLQVVMSLLNAQASYIADDLALSAIQQSQHRVQAMALIHQKLYQAEGLARIPMAAYIQELVAYLHDSYEYSQPISFELQVEPIELDITQAVPLGLIINEALTNALKHAFPHQRSGMVRVELKEPQAGEYELVVADDGVGLPADFAAEQSRSLGLTLIRGFSEQLEGQLCISPQPGLRISLQFHDEVHTVNA